MSVLRYFLPNGGDILLNFTHIMDFFAEWKAADSENNFLYHLFWFLYYNNQFKMHNNFKQTKIKRTGQSPLNGAEQVLFAWQVAKWETWCSSKKWVEMISFRQFNTVWGSFMVFCQLHTCLCCLSLSLCVCVWSSLCFLRCGWMCLKMYASFVSPSPAL